MGGKGQRRKNHLYQHFWSACNFSHPLASERTKVDISSDIFASLYGLLSENDSNLFTLQREQMVVYEKKEATL
jgi:hypothetical protein